MVTLRRDAFGVELDDMTRASINAKAATLAEALVNGDSCHEAPLSKPIT